MKKFLNVFLGILGWAVTLLCIAALIFAIFSFLQSKKTGEPTTIVGYRPVYVLTGSMEPYMLTDGIVITKEVKSLDELKEGDVVTYHVEDSHGKKIVVTHRIKTINEDGTIVTKGDNNRVEDAIPITIENVEAKVVFVCNWVAGLVHLWAKRKGKVIIITCVAGVILFFVLMKALLGGDDDDEDPDEKKKSRKKDNKDTDDNEEPKAVENVAAEIKDTEQKAVSAVTAGADEPDASPEPSAEPEQAADSTLQAEASDSSDEKPEPGSNDEKPEPDGNDADDQTSDDSYSEDHDSDNSKAVEQTDSLDKEEGQNPDEGKTDLPVEEEPKPEEDKGKGRLADGSIESIYEEVD